MLNDDLESNPGTYYKYTRSNRGIPRSGYSSSVKNEYIKSRSIYCRSINMCKLNTLAIWIFLGIILFSLVYIAFFSHRMRIIYSLEMLKQTSGRSRDIPSKNENQRYKGSKSSAGEDDIYEYRENRDIEADEDFTEKIKKHIINHQFEVYSESPLVNHLFMENFNRENNGNENVNPRADIFIRNREKAHLQKNNALQASPPARGDAPPDSGASYNGDTKDKATSYTSIDPMPRRYYTKDTSDKKESPGPRPESHNTEAVRRNDVNKVYRSTLHANKRARTSIGSMAGIFSFPMEINISRLINDVDGIQRFKKGPIPSFSTMKCATYKLGCLYSNSILVVANESDDLVCSVKRDIIHIIVKNTIIKRIEKTLRNAESPFIKKNDKGGINLEKCFLICTFRWIELT